MATSTAAVGLQMVIKEKERRIAELEEENQRLRDELWKEEKFCRGSGDIDRANELAALLEGG